MWTTMIIDDEPDARILLKNMLANCCPDFEIVTEAASVKDAAQKLHHHRPHIVFLDIQMDDGTGFDLLEQIPKPDFHVVFVTAFDDFALKAFRYNALDYLLKPINPDDLERVIKRLRRLPPPDQQQLQLLLDMLSEKSQRQIVLRTAEGNYYIPLHKVIRLESEGNYTTVYSTSEKPITVSRNLGYFKFLLSLEPFFHSHQSHIVNLDFVRGYFREDGGYILLTDKSRIPLSHKHKNDFLQYMNKR